MKTLKSTKLAVLILSAMLLVAGIVGITASAEGTPSLEIYSKNLSYGGTISIAFAVDAQNIGENDVELLVYKSEPADDAVADYTVTEYETDTVHEREALVFLTPGIAAKDMTQEIYVRAHAVVDGADVYSEVERYSVAEYAYDMQYRSKINENFEKLGAALLEVGEQIQTLLEYKVDESPADFVYIAAEGGTVDGKYAAGLFKAGESFTLNYNGEIPEGKKAYWVYDSNKVTNGATVKASSHAVYTVAFEDSYDKYVAGVYYNDETKDGTRHDDASTVTGQSQTFGIANNAIGKFDVGTTYIIETDFTYNGGTPVNASDWGAAFLGLQIDNAPHNTNMFLWSYVTYLDEEGSAVRYLGADLLKGVTYNLRFEYTVGDGIYPTASGTANKEARSEYLKNNFKFFVNGVEMSTENMGNVDMGTNAYAVTGSDATFWGLGIQTRSSSYNSADFSVTFDNAFIAPKAALPDGQIETYYTNTSIEGTRYPFDEGTDGVAIYNTHTSNKETYGALYNVNGALNVANNPRWYGFAFLNSNYTAGQTYANGTQFVFEADVTLNSYTGVTEANPAFVGFFGESGTINNNYMYSTGIYSSYDFTANSLDIFGAKIGLEETVKVTLIYTVGGSTVDVYAGGNFVGTASCGSGTNFYGFGFYVRGGAGTADKTQGLDMTFDNVFLGVIEAAAE